MSEESVRNRTWERIYQGLGYAGVCDLLRPWVPDIDRLGGQVRGNVQCICPENHTHGDATPSMPVDLEKGVYYCHVCGKKVSGSLLALVAQKRGITVAELIAELCTKLGISQDDTSEDASLTVEAYVAAKHLPVDYLKDVFHIEQAKNGIEMPYHDEAGNLITCRYRRKLEKPATGKDTRFFWAKGSKASNLVYGLWKLPSFAQGGTVIICEGESDTHAGWWHGLPVLGIPGKSMPLDALAQYIVKYQTLTKVYVVVEPDAVGVFDKNLQTALALAGYKGQLYSVKLSCKDLCDLHVGSKDGDEFNGMWAEAVNKAVLMEPKTITPLLQILNNIRKEQMPLYERQQMIAEAVRTELLENGEFICTKNSTAFFFDRCTHTLYPIDADLFKLSVYLYELGGLNKADQDWRFISYDILSYALSKGKETEVWRFCRFQNSKLYLSRFNGEMYILDGDNVIEATNGTDGVLFLDPPDWEPWKYLPKSEVFKLSHLVNSINFDTTYDTFDIAEYRLLFVTSVLSLFFADLLPAKPLTLFLGEKGSGKTSITRRIGQLLYGQNYDVSILEDKSENFLTMLENYYLVALDNVDGNISWLNNKLATTATGGHTTKRKLYTDNSEYRIRPRCFIWLSSRTPKFRRDDVADRLIIFRLKRIDTGQKLSERDLLCQIATYRYSLWGEVIELLNRIVKYLRCHDISGKAVNFRLADFAISGEAIVRALNNDEESVAKDWHNLLDKMEGEQQDFSMDDDVLPQLISMLLGDKESVGPYSPPELYDAINAEAGKKNIVLPYKNQRAISRRLATIRQTLEERLGISIDQHVAAHGVTMRTFKRVTKAK